MSEIKITRLILFNFVSQKKVMYQDQFQKNNDLKKCFCVKRAFCYLPECSFFNRQDTNHLNITVLEE